MDEVQKQRGREGPEMHSWHAETGTDTLYLAPGICAVGKNQSGCCQADDGHHVEGQAPAFHAQGLEVAHIGAKEAAEHTSCRAWCML